jgi:Cupin domain
MTSGAPGPPLHVHEFDEGFYVLVGELTFQVGDELLKARAGEFAYGREFLSAHRHLDQVVDEWRELEDAVAERAAAIGIAPDGGAAAVIELADVRPVDSGFTEVGCRNRASLRPALGSRPSSPAALRSAWRT